MKYAILTMDEPFISFAELKSLLDCEKDISYFSGVAIFNKETKNIARRSSNIKAIGKVLAISDDPKDINDVLRGKCFNIKPNIILQSDKDKFNALYSEIKKGVTLNKQCNTLDLIFTDGIIIAGLREDERDSKSLLLHSKKPFSQSGTMDAYTSRLMVNLANPKNLVFDPFAGVGSILIESAWIGYNCIGSDIDIKMLEKSKANLNYFGYNCDLLQSNIANNCIQKVDAIVTDPPYGRSVNAKEVKMEELYEKLFSISEEILRKKGKLVFATDAKYDWRDKIKEFKLSILGIHYIYLHKSLSRAIYVVQKI
ncbi:methyltransferase [Acidianus sulfidivorans JP7]|uniref:tRNA (guanine(10)-N(2))-dimethyltransferase n=1 Tax=Acidianus sulfidivorans JP7 TaxID=619593 RepID=A0A2U9INT3_9CREN|nr:methyltransferase [Acidianus sulfidivorans]AWR97672.1 methyltransferase [Acidianus sulfidivorans JP7]